jgi:hypothetical protein
MNGFYKLIRNLCVLSIAFSAVSPSDANAFFDAIIKEATKNINNSMSSKSSGNAGSKNGAISVIERLCSGFTGSAMPTRVSNVDEELGKYFKVTSDFEAYIRSAIHSPTGKQTMQSIKDVVEDLYLENAKRFGRNFVSNPSKKKLADLIWLARESTDIKDEEDGPSLKGEMNAFLGAVLIQYHSALKSLKPIKKVLEVGDAESSGLARALLARTLLFGEFAKKSINESDTVLASASENFPIALADKTILYRLKTDPNFSQRRLYESLLQSGGSITNELNRQKRVAKLRPSDLQKKTADLMRKGLQALEKVNAALRFGSSSTQTQATGDYLSKLSSGSKNLIEISARTSVQASNEIKALIGTSPKLDDNAKKALKKAQDEIGKNLAQAKKLENLLIARMLSAGLNMISGESLNQMENLSIYYTSSCDAVTSTVSFSQKIGVPEPTITKKELEDAF